MNNLKSLMKNKVFIFAMLSNSNSYFIATAVQFWATDYSVSVLGVQKELVFLWYSVVSITGPTLGIVVGGALCHYFGGYTKISAAYICVVFGLLGMCCAIPIGFTSNFYIFMPLLWLVLFFGGGVVPIMIGMMISAVEVQGKTTASSIASVASNLLGGLPAPFVYGLVCQVTGGAKSPYGMIGILYTSVLAEVFIICVAVQRNKSSLIK